MILTCPACDTKYVVKDGAIPPGGRQVRCASCKHSWHQDPEIMAAEPATAVDMDLGGPPPAPAEPVEEPLADIPMQSEVGEIAGQPQPVEPEESPWGTVATEPVESTMPLAGAKGADEVAMEEAPAIADEWRATEAVEAAATPAADEDFVGYAPIAEDNQPVRRRWPLILTLLTLIAAAAAAFWFLAPAEWKARAGIAQGGLTPLQLMITTSDRQALQSGNELVAISGRVINPTDREQQVPPIRAELRDRQTRKLVHRWTIAPPARVLAPRSSASFNSAEVDVPKGGDELTVTLDR
jgi:predicted Zn finger-like uncharacterized protein